MSVIDREKVVGVYKELCECGYSLYPFKKFVDKVVGRVATTGEKKVVDDILKGMGVVRKKGGVGPVVLVGLVVQEGVEEKLKGYIEGMRLRMFDRFLLSDLIEWMGEKNVGVVRVYIRSLLKGMGVNVVGVGDGYVYAVGGVENEFGMDMYYRLTELFNGVVDVRPGRYTMSQVKKIVMDSEEKVFDGVIGVGMSEEFERCLVDFLAEQYRVVGSGLFELM